VTGPARERHALRIEAPYFVAGVEVEDGRVARTAPIVHWLYGWAEEAVLDHAAAKGWAVTRLPGEAEAR
jgi:hypothetical protein